jgi:hypothetical protein
MGRVRWKPLLIELPTIVAIDEQTDGTIKCIRTTRETTRRSSQTSQIVAQLSIPCFNREGICLALRNFISTVVIPKAIIGIKCVTVIHFSLGRLVHHILDSLLGAFPDHIPAEETAGVPIYERDDVDSVFLSPIKVNNSSISASLTSSGMGTSGKLAACAATQSETVR